MSHSEQELEAMFTDQESDRKLPYDTHPVLASTLRDLNRQQFEQVYLPSVVTADVLAANDRTYEQRLAATKMIAQADDPTPTVLSLLVLGNSPRDFLPGAYVQFLRIAGTDLADTVVDQQVIGGTIGQVLTRIDDKLASHNRVAVDFTSGPIERRTQLYPIVALQQIVRNAVMHRTYEATNAPIHVYWFDDRIEVNSPGGPYGAVTASSSVIPGLSTTAIPISRRRFA